MTDGELMDDRETGVSVPPVENRDTAPPDNDGAEMFARLIENCKARNFTAEVVPDGASARARLAELIPEGADITTGGSMTLRDIGFIDDAQAGKNGWHYRRIAIYAEPDEFKRDVLRRSAMTAQYIIGSVNALSMDGQAVCIDHGGTRVGAYCYGTEKVIWVVGRNKIVPTLDDALARARGHVFALESERVRREWNSHSAMFKTLIFEGEHRPDRIHIVLVDEPLGF